MYPATLLVFICERRWWGESNAPWNSHRQILARTRGMYRTLSADYGPSALISYSVWDGGDELRTKFSAHAQYFVTRLPGQFRTGCFYFKPCDLIVQSDLRFREQLQCDHHIRKSMYKVLLYINLSVHTLCAQAIMLVSIALAKLLTF